MRANAKKTKLPCLAVFLLLLAPAAAPGQTPANKSLIQQVAPEVQTKAMLNSMSYHKSPSVNKAEKIVIALLYDESIPAQKVAAIKAGFEKNKDTKIGKKTFSVIEISFATVDELKKKLSAAKANAVYIVSGSEGAARKAVSATRNLKMLSMAGDPDHVHWLGVCLGVESKLDKLKILINLSGCKIEGVHFDPRLLRIASVSF